MARVWFILMLSALLVLGGLPLAAALPEVEDEIYWFQVDDEEGDEPEECLRLNDMSQPTPCDLVSFEMGNTDTHFLYRFGVATTEFGTSGQFGHVDYNVRMRGTSGVDDGHELTVRLDSGGGLELQEIVPADWEGGLEFALEGDLITVAVPLDQIGGMFAEGAAVPHTSWLNLSSVRSEWQLVTGGTGPLGERGGDSMDDVTGRQAYVIQAYGDLETPEIDPIVVEETVTGDTFHAEESFNTGPPSMDDPCVPWNETCFMNAQPTTAHYVYKWALDLPSVEFSFSQEIVNGSADLVVIDDFDTELARIPSAEAAAGIQEIISPIQTNVLTLVVELDRFEGSFEIDAKEGPPPQDGGSDDGTDHSDHDMDGGDDGDSADGDGSDLEESGGIPGPAVAVLLAVLAGLVHLRRRR